MRRNKLTVRENLIYVFENTWKYGLPINTAAFATATSVISFKPNANTNPNTNSNSNPNSNPNYNPVLNGYRKYVKFDFDYLHTTT